MAVKKQRPGEDARPEWKRPPPNMLLLAVMEANTRELPPDAPRARPSGGPKPKAPRYRLEREARGYTWRAPVRTAIAEAIHDERDPFGALVDLAERLDIDVVCLVTATIETELTRRGPTLKMPGRTALDATDASYLLWRLESYRKAAEAAAANTLDPAEAALASFVQSWAPIRPENRETAKKLASKIVGRGREALTVALEVLREDEPDLVRVLVGRRTATEARKRLKLLVTRDLETASDARWLAVKARAEEMIRSASKR